jgi:hypothetical protein
VRSEKGSVDQKQSVVFRVEPSWLVRSGKVGTIVDEVGTVVDDLGNDVVRRMEERQWSALQRGLRNRPTDDETRSCRRGMLWRMLGRKMRRCTMEW